MFYIRLGMVQLFLSTQVAAFPLLGRPFRCIRTSLFIRHAFVRGELHNITTVKPTGLGKMVASKPNRVLAQGKRIIWDNSNSSIENDLLRADLEVARKRCQQFAPSKIAPAMELSRYEAYTQLKLYFENHVKVRLTAILHSTHIFKKSRLSSTS